MSSKTQYEGIDSPIIISQDGYGTVLYFLLNVIETDDSVALRWHYSLGIHF